MKNPSLGVVNLAVFGVFMIVAGFGSIVPNIVVDRMARQFRPLWECVLATPDDEWSMINSSIAIASQWAIGLTELAIGATAIAGVFSPRRRQRLAMLSFCAGTVLFGTFMIVLFFLHEASLPTWNQYPVILVWIAVMQVLLERPVAGYLPR